MTGQNVQNLNGNNVADRELLYAGCYGAYPPSFDGEKDYYPALYPEQIVTSIYVKSELRGGPWISIYASAFLKDGTNISIISTNGTYSGTIPLSAKLTEEQITDISYIRICARVGANGGDGSQKPRGEVKIMGHDVLWQ